jgi:hypothetical protein
MHMESRMAKAMTRCRRTKMIAAPILAAAALLLSGQVAAETFKCSDANGKITYSGKKCSDLGLKDAGEVKDQINVTPAYRPPAQTAGSRPPSSPPPPPAVTVPSPEAPAAETDSPNPDRRCFKTAKGTFCNDRPEEEAPADAKPAQ